MPWCEACARFWNPSTMQADGSCPDCGDRIAEPDEVETPWHFKLLVASVALYLGWRAVQGVGWVIENV